MTMTLPLFPFVIVLVVSIVASVYMFTLNGAVQSEIANECHNCNHNIDGMDHVPQTDIKVVVAA